MGKRIIPQRRGSGSPVYKYPSFWNTNRVKYLPLSLGEESLKLKVVDIIRDKIHSAPIAVVKYKGKEYYHVATQGLAVNQVFHYYNKDENANPGDVLMLKDIPEGTLIFNIENVPGDGGKFVRSSGTSARIITKTNDYVIVEMPSKKEKRFLSKCRATVGIVAGGGRVEKPFVKAGNKYYYAKKGHKYWPVVSKNAMNAVDHPFGNKRSLRKSKAKPVSRNAPPGRKVGYIAARRTGRKKK